MTNYDKLISTLKEVFMLDKAELDFGIYRIMNEKRKDIEQFLEVDLVPQVQKVLAESLSIDKQAIQKELDDTIKQALGIGADPESLPKVHALRAKLGEAADMVGIENEVFSLLANFFKRYFDNGDFISMRRYKKDVYAIPYEGEEVKLHWANADQYYIKSSEYFKVYRVKLGGGKAVVFELVEASTEQNNNKTQGDKERRFAIQKTYPCEIAGDEFKIYFTYEPTDKGVKQNDLLQEAFDVVKGQIPKEFVELLTLRPTQKDKTRTLLQKHLMDYTARNTFDYFIHKDLGGFLTRELDFYIKNEVLFIDDLNTRDEQEFLKQLSKIKAIKKIGEKIIAFLAQLENFQKKLWLKKKMVVECQYCITLDRVPKELYPDILSNQAQIDEWVKLFAIHEITDQKAKDMFAIDRVGFSSPLSLEFLNQNQFLVLDTVFFPETFKWKVIGSIENFDERCDGLLMNTDNFQGISLLQSKYSEKIKAFYLDPPYNTGGDGFLYKDSFQHSSWLSMIYDSLNESRKLLKNNGVYFLSIDDKENYNLSKLIQSQFGHESLISSMIWKKTDSPNEKDSAIATYHEYLIVFSPNGINNVKLYQKLKPEILDAYDKEINGKKYRHRQLRKNGKAARRIDRPNMYYKLEAPDGTIVWPLAPEGWEGRWVCSYDTFKDLVNKNEIVWTERAYGWVPYYFEWAPEEPYSPFESIIDDVGQNRQGKAEYTSIMGDFPFDTPKPTKLIRRTIEIALAQEPNGIMIDYFAGSATTAHAIIDYNVEKGGNRKYILMEMAEYFEVLTKPRVSRRIYSKDWKDSKPVSREGISHCFKYMRLESYEDTLNNLQLTRNNTQELALNSNPKFKEGYMLHYMLDVESQGSLLNLDWFINPFECYLQVTKNNELVDTKVDLVETFNYLIGLVVENYAVPKDGYVVVTGKNLAGESILVIWRDCAKHDNTALNIFLEKSKYNPLDGEFDRIFVNGDNNVENLKTGDERWKVVLIEEEFKKRMFENS